MSETFPFSSPPAPGEDSGDGSGSSRFGGRAPLLIVGGAVATVVLGIAAWLLLFSGGGDETEPTAAPARKQAATPSSTAGATPRVTVLPSVTLNGRNPFVPLLSPPPPAAPTPVRTVPTPQPTSQPTSQPTTTPAPPPAAPPPAAPPTAAPPTAAPTTAAPSIRLRLSAVSADNSRAVFHVGSTKYVVEPEKTFATNFVLVRLDRGAYATVAYGSATIVDMSEGETLEFR